MAAAGSHTLTAPWHTPGICTLPWQVSRLRHSVGTPASRRFPKQPRRCLASAGSLSHCQPTPSWELASNLCLTSVTPALVTFFDFVCCAVLCCDCCDPPTRYIEYTCANNQQTPTGTMAAAAVAATRCAASLAWFRTRASLCQLRSSSTWARPTPTSGTPRAAHGQVSMCDLMRHLPLKEAHSLRTAAHKLSWLNSTTCQ